MIKKWLKYFVPIALLIAAICTVIWMSAENIEYSEDMFAISNSHLIDRIVISDGSNKEVVLEKNGDNWIVNGADIARQSQVSIIVNMLPMLLVDVPAEKAVNNAINKGVVKLQKQVRFFIDKKEILYSFYNVETRVVATINNSSQAYYLTTPGYALEFSSALSLNDSYWKSKAMYSWNSLQIDKLSVEYSDAKTESFVIEKHNDMYVVSSLNNNKTISSNETEKIFSYLSFASSLEFDDFLTDNQVEVYNGLKGNADVVISVVVEGELHKLNVFYKPDSNSETGFDLYKVFVQMDNSEPVVVSFLKMDNLLKDYRYFNK
ncbi:MAG: hypothetical protein JXA53_04585 [Bacteroidales bacterium]|nr:hypothetical protein [Bacteroidales bacterium]